MAERLYVDKVVLQTRAQNAGHDPDKKVKHIKAKDVKQMKWIVWNIIF